VPFTVTIPPEDRDPDLKEKLKAEWPAILQWATCLAGAREHRVDSVLPLH
jgi:phage/plasmid-associated DNA primase